MISFSGAQLYKQQKVLHMFYLKQHSTVRQDSNVQFIIL